MPSKKRRGAYRYYAQEAERHPDLNEKTLSKEKVVEVLNALNREHKLPPIQLRFHKRPKNTKRATSWYQAPTYRRGKPIEEHISMEEGMLSLRHVAHEWAHYAHRHDYRARKRLNPNLPPERSHGPQHLKIFEQAVDFLRRKGPALVKSALPVQRKPRAGGVVRDMLPQALELLAGRDPEKLTPEEKSAIDLKVREQYMASLPAQLACPKCQEQRPQAMFGARVMARNPQGLPARVSRQSQCVCCRNKKKEK